MNKTESSRSIASKVAEVRERIREATLRTGRPPDAVRLIAVSKYASADDGVIGALHAAGCRDLGESRPQLLLEKAERFADSDIRWHMIGTLQRNKIRKILPYVTLIHSVDSVRLAEAIDRIAAEFAEETVKPFTVHGLLEVAISHDAAKHGFEPKELAAALDELSQLKHFVVDGLMGMSGLESTDDDRRRQFETLRNLSEVLRKNGTPENVRLSELSMGMSDDFEIAVESGATLVRVGSLLFQEP